MAHFSEMVTRDTKMLRADLVALNLVLHEWNSGQMRQIRILKDAIFLLMTNVERIAIRIDMIEEGTVGPGKKFPHSPTRSRPGSF